jgi:hypothetical protein
MFISNLYFHRPNAYNVKSTLKDGVLTGDAILYVGDAVAEPAGPSVHNQHPDAPCKEADTIGFPVKGTVYVIAGYVPVLLNIFPQAVWTA